MEEYQGSSILEVQARSCEYSHMFKLDGMRAALLEHIPPLDESTYTRNLGSSQVIDAAGAAQVNANLEYCQWFGVASCPIRLHTGIVWARLCFPEDLAKLSAVAALL